MPDNRGENKFQSEGMILREYPPLIFWNKHSKEIGKNVNRRILRIGVTIFNTNIFHRLHFVPSL